MGMFDGWLLASDVDETLISDGKVPLRNLEKIDFFVKEGGCFALCSGRSVEALNTVVKQIKDGNVGASITFNGGVIYDFEAKRALSEENLSQREKAFTKYVILNMPEIGMEVHTKDVCYVPNRTEYTDLHEEYEDIDARFCSYEEIENLDWVKVIFIPYTEEKRRMLRDAAESFTDGSSVFYDTSAVIQKVQNMYLEQLPIGVSKGNTLKKLRNILNIPSGKLCAIGDYYNDISMLEVSDVTAVTAGAPDDLKQMAEYITCSCADGAVADFIDYLKQKL